MNSKVTPTPKFKKMMEAVLATGIAPHGYTEVVYRFEGVSAEKRDAVETIVRQFGFTPDNLEDATIEYCELYDSLDRCFTAEKVGETYNIVLCDTTD